MRTDDDDLPFRSEGSLEARRMEEALAAKMFGTTHQPVSVGRYEIQKRLGTGGMGTVYDAYDPQLGRNVAVKILKTQHGERDSSVRERMLREGRALARLAHPNVVTVFESGELGNDVFVAMELVDGGDLRSWLEAHPPGTRARTREAIALLMQAAEGLRAAHAAGLVHRDFKPSNVLVGADERVRVADFGLVRATELGSIERRHQSVETLRSTDTGSAVLTRTGSLLGTIAYMSPEQLRGEPADERSDQFSFCVAAFEVLFGTRPFRGKSAAAILDAIESQRIVPTPSVGVPARLASILRTGLQTEPGRRHASMDALIEAVERSTRRRQQLYIGATVLAVTAGGLGLREGLSTPPDPCPRADPSPAVWSGQRSRVRDAFTSSGFSFASNSLTRVESALDEWGDAWADKRVSVCRATKADGAQSDEALDLRMHCLDRLVARARAPLSIITDAEAAPHRLRQAEQLMTTLPKLEKCDDVERLRRRHVDRPKDDEDALDELREDIAVGRALFDIHQFPQAQALARQTVERARPFGPSDVLAEALELDLLRVCKGDECDASLEEALELAVRFDRPDVEARLWARKGSLLSRNPEALDAAWVAYDAAYSATRRADEPTAARIAVLIQHAHAENTKAQNPDRAIELCESAVKLVEGEYGEHAAELVTPLLQYIQPLRTSGRHGRALEVAQRAIEIGLDHYGAQNTLITDAQRELGQALGNQGRVEEAIPWIERSLQTDLSLLGPHNSSTAESYNLLAQLHQELEQWELSLEAFDAALEAYEDGYPTLIPGLLGLRAKSLGKLERIDEAVADLDRAIKLAIEINGETHYVTELAYSDRGDFWTSRKEWDLALADHRKALEIVKAQTGEVSIYAAGYFRRIGGHLLEKQQFDEAIAAFERARDIAKPKDPHKPHHVLAVLGLADTLRKRNAEGDAARSKELLLGARDVAATLEGPKGEDLAKRVEKSLDALEPS